MWLTIQANGSLYEVDIRYSKINDEEELKVKISYTIGGGEVIYTTKHGTSTYGNIEKTVLPLITGKIVEETWIIVKNFVKAHALAHLAYAYMLI